MALCSLGVYFRCNNQLIESLYISCNWQSSRDRDRLNVECVHERNDRLLNPWNVEISLTLGEFCNTSHSDPIELEVLFYTQVCPLNFVAHSVPSANPSILSAV